MKKVRLLKRGRGENTEYSLYDELTNSVINDMYFDTAEEAMKYAKYKKLSISNNIKESMLMKKQQLLEIIKRVIREEKRRISEGWEIEAYGVKGMKSSQWRKKFKSPEQLEKWCDTNDAEVQGTSYLLNGREIRQSDPEYQDLPNNFKGE